MDVSNTTDGSRPGLRRQSLGAGRIAFFVVAAVAPLAGIAGAAPVVFIALGPSAPAVFVLAGLLFVLFSVGFVAMSRHVSNAGGYIAYIARGLGGRSAAAAGYVSLLAYLSVQLALWSQLSVFTRELLLQVAGIDVPVWLCLYVLLVVATVIVCRGADVSIAVAGVLLALEMLVLVVLIVGAGISGALAGNVPASFDFSGLLSPGLGVGFLFAVSAFIGFEATVMFSEEAKDAHRTVPGAIAIAIAVIASSYALAAWALSVSVGPSVIQEAAAADPVGLLLSAAQDAVGGWFAVAVNVLIITSYLASLIGSLNMFARLVFAMGRSGIIPSWFGRTTKAGAPARAASGIGIVVAAVLAVFLLAGADLIAVVFSWFLALGTTALLVILFLTSIAVVTFFARNPSLERGPWRTLIFPIIAALGLLTTGYLAIANYDLLLGGSGDAARWLLLLIPLTAAAGWVTASRASALPDFAADLG